MACYHSQRRNLGDPRGAVKMTKHETKGDKPKANGKPLKGVRLPDSSAEAPVMGVERSGQQSSNHVQNSHPINIGGQGEQRSWKGKPFLDRWTRISLRAQRHPSSTFHNLLLHINEETLQEAFRELDGSKAPGVDGITKSEYGKNLQQNLETLAERVKGKLQATTQKRSPYPQRQRQKFALSL